ncbi:MAG: BA14K family protein [Rhodobiaceae bacterium]|nr:BA14K family protein [Rhodobiaceae bacterium]MCC0061114.1 BA14K family protein [Rhodobiaceae bacterium]
MTKVMKTLSVLGLSAAVAGSVMAFNPAPAEAGSAGKVAAGIAAGVAIGIIANEAAHAHERNHQPQRSSSWRTNKHIDWCYRHYPNSYNEYENTYVNLKGRLRTCRSPYWG